MSTQANYIDLGVRFSVCNKHAVDLCIPPKKYLLGVHNSQEHCVTELYEKK